MRYIVSTCGTSLLTKETSQKEKEFLRNTANYKESDLSSEEKTQIDKILKGKKEMFLEAPVKEKRKLSAEMNGLIGLFDEKKPESNDICLFLHSHTYQGELVAQVLADCIKGDMGIKHCETRLIKDLNMLRLDEFRLGLSELASWAHNECRVYKEKGYEVIFNLVGGFKTFQGFMQILGMLYADSSVYIFEGQGSPILRIPSLPLQLEEGLEKVFKDNIRIFRTINWYSWPSAELHKIPETLLMSFEGEYTLSPWGEIVWNKFKEDHYGDMLFEEPTNNIRFSDSFKRKIKDFDRERLKTLNERIDDLALFLSSSSKPNLSRLDFKPLRSNPVPPSTHEFDAWADRGAWRCFCHFEKNVLLIDDIGPGIGH
jgi:putative CRISPR-associated protein (TIGR02619 family)